MTVCVFHWQLSLVATVTPLMAACAGRSSQGTSVILVSQPPLNCSCYSSFEQKLTFANFPILQSFVEYFANSLWLVYISLVRLIIF